MNNLLDNAGKYSFSNSVVQVNAGLMANNTLFYVGVSNTGIAIRGEEVKRVVERGYRALAARASTSEGHGIGLWIVDQIMQAHNGRLIISPTTNASVTAMRLVFPRSTGLS